MKNSDLNNEYQDDEIDLRDLFRVIFNSKKLIIVMTLGFSLLAFIYSVLPNPLYKSSAVIRIGAYDLVNGEKKLLEPIKNLITLLNTEIFSLNNKEKLDLDPISSDLLKINFISPSPDLGENKIKDAMIFIQERHTQIQANIVNLFSEQIVALDHRIEFNKNPIENQQEFQKFEAISAIRTIDNKIPNLESKIKLLLKLISELENYVLLLESNPSALLQRLSSSPPLEQIIYSYYEQILNIETEIQDLKHKKDTLEFQLKSIAEEGSTSEELFNLNQEKDTLEMQVKLVNDQVITTHLIREIETSEIKTHNTKIILIGAILGFIFSVLIVLIRETFLKKQN